MQPTKTNPKTIDMEQRCIHYKNGSCTLLKKECVLLVDGSCDRIAHRWSE